MPARSARMHTRYMSIGRILQSSNGPGKGKRRSRAPGDMVPPTPERAQHDPIERVGHQILDAHGNIGSPFRVVDTLAIMERRGTISAAMHLAGVRFRDDFSAGLLDRIKGMTLVRADSGTRDGLAVHQLDARNRVHAAMATLGGNGSPAGSCAWHVIGEGRSTKEWALGVGWSGRSLSQETAAGILIAVLGILVAHYGLDQSGSNRR